MTPSLTLGVFLLYIHINTHTHTHTYIYIYTYTIYIVISVCEMAGIEEGGAGGLERIYFVQTRVFTIARTSAAYGFGLSSTSRALPNLSL